VKILSNEIEILFEKFQKGSPFCFSKFSDGEWAAMQNEILNNTEFENTTNTPLKYREELRDAIRYKDENYYIGVCCECCNGDRAQKMKDFCGQDEDHMTFANVFVNGNYPRYKETFLKSYESYDVHLVANRNSKFENLPFKPEKIYPIGFSAWVNDYHLIEEIKQQNLSNKLFLFCAGPFGNLLAHQLHEHNKNNIYLDAGSTLNPWLKSEGFAREYYLENSESRFKGMDCTWN
jgi:hypothetical protein